MNDQEQFNAMLMRLEVASVHISNVASRYKGFQLLEERRIAHSLMEIIDACLRSLGVSRHTPRLEGKVPVAFLASFVRLDELDELRAFMEDRLRAEEAEMTRWNQEQGTP